MSEMMVEIVARAMLLRASEPLGNLESLEPVLVGGLGDAWEYLARAAIAAHITALAEAGYVIVPREPTEKMLAVAGRYNHPRDAEVWRAMIDAALAE